MLFYIACVDRPGALQLRLDTRSDHLAYLEDFQGRIVFGGPTMGGEEETPNGSVLIVDIQNQPSHLPELFKTSGHSLVHQSFEGGL